MHCAEERKLPGAAVAPGEIGVPDQRSRRLMRVPFTLTSAMKPALLRAKPTTGC
jgi:hypothetical protein